MAPSRYHSAVQFVLGLVILAAPRPLMAQSAFKLQLGGRWVEGTPLVATEKQVFLLARDGQMWEFAPSDAQSYSKSRGPVLARGKGENQAAGFVVFLGGVWG